MVEFSVEAKSNRVTRPGGLYVSQHKSPVNLQARPQAKGDGLWLGETYYRSGAVANYRAGFVVEDLVEPMHADHAAEQGSFGHRSQFVAPYARIKARRLEPTERTSVVGVE